MIYAVSQLARRFRSPDGSLSGRLINLSYTDFNSSIKPAFLRFIIRNSNTCSRRNGVSFILLKRQLYEILPTFGWYLSMPPQPTTDTTLSINSLLLLDIVMTGRILIEILRLPLRESSIETNTDPSASINAAIHALSTSDRTLIVPPTRGYGKASIYNLSNEYMIHITMKNHRTTNSTPGRCGHSPHASRFFMIRRPSHA